MGGVAGLDMYSVREEEVRQRRTQHDPHNTCPSIVQWRIVHYQSSPLLPNQPNFSSSNPRRVMAS